MIYLHTCFQLQYPTQRLINPATDQHSFLLHSIWPSSSTRQYGNINERYPDQRGIDNKWEKA